MIPKKLYLFILAAMVSVVMAGCGEGEQKSENAPGKDQANRPVAQKKYEPVYGDMMIRESIGDVSVLLPVLANDQSSFDIIGWIYNGLVKYDKDLKLVTDLAEKWEIS
jgi:peptide/nickel transport system substrate-binding protein